MPKLVHFFGSAFTDNGSSDIHVAPIVFSWALEGLDPVTVVALGIFWKKIISFTDLK